MEEGEALLGLSCGRDATMEEPCRAHKANLRWRMTALAIAWQGLFFPRFRFFVVSHLDKMCYSINEHEWLPQKAVSF